MSTVHLLETDRIIKGGILLVFWFKNKIKNLPVWLPDWLNSRSTRFHPLQSLNLRPQTLQYLSPQCPVPKLSVLNPISLQQMILETIVPQPMIPFPPVPQWIIWPVQTLISLPWPLPEPIKERIQTSLDKVLSLKPATITAAATDAILISAALPTKESESFTPMIPVAPQ